MSHADMKREVFLILLGFRNAVPCSSSTSGADDHHTTDTVRAALLWYEVSALSGIEIGCATLRHLFKNFLSSLKIRHFEVNDHTRIDRSRNETESNWDRRTDHVQSTVLMNILNRFQAQIMTETKPVTGTVTWLAVFVFLLFGLVNFNQSRCFLHTVCHSFV